MRIRTGLALGLLLALSVAGCAGDGGSKDQVATAGGSTPSASASAKPGDADDPDAMLAYSKCMRENGLPDFPDPEVGEGGGFSLKLPEGYPKEKIDKAQEVCKKHLPNGGEPPKADPEQLEKMRQYAKCMRENGVPKFPDPTDSGLQINGNEVGGPDDPAFKAADEKCRSLMPGPAGGGSLERKDG